MTGVSWHRGCPVGLRRTATAARQPLGLRRRGPPRPPRRPPRLGRRRCWDDAERSTASTSRSAACAWSTPTAPTTTAAWPPTTPRPSTAASSPVPIDWSEHAYGHAIDVNPVENPYVTADGYVSPPAGAPYADRSRRVPGLIHAARPGGRRLRRERLGLGRRLVLAEGLPALLGRGWLRRRES